MSDRDPILPVFSPRALVLSDGSALAALYRTCFPEKTIADDIAKKVLKDEPALVLVLDGENELTAFAYAWFIGDELQLLDLGVSPTYRRQGLARTIMQALAQAGRARGVTRITLEVRVDNLPAHVLYDALGFVAVGRRLAYYPDGCDALLLDWVL